MGYGYKYCEKFQEERARLSDAGQEWMVDVMLCLQRKLISQATGTSNITTCAELKDYAFSTHSQCYVDSGFCALPPTDWLAVIEIVSLETMLESFDSLSATTDTAGECVEFYLWAVENGML
ncbi:hypothetical protein PHISP_03797 [Aspergillus sp. HF37]|nr:hypothetical protein PHISP_03797 [Aspergillus sp. HF37]